MALVGSVPRAEQAAAAGVDLVVAQGTEGGGHTGHIGTMALLPAVVDAVDVPVLAAGGIVDGRGLAAARCLGAAGVWMGTRFIASAEAYGHPAYKQRVVDGHQPGDGHQPLVHGQAAANDRERAGPVRGRIARTRSSPSRPSTRWPG